MIRATALAFAAATILGATGVQAQSVDIGPNGPSIDLRSNRQRDRDVQRDDYRRDRDYDRRSSRNDRRDRDIATGSTGCRVVTVRERDDSGRMVTRETRDCR